MIHESWLTMQDRAEKAFDLVGGTIYGINGECPAPLQIKAARNPN